MVTRWRDDKAGWRAVSARPDLWPPGVAVWVVTPNNEIGHCAASYRMGRTTPPVQPEPTLAIPGSLEATLAAGAWLDRTHDPRPLAEQAWEVDPW